MGLSELIKRAAEQRQGEWNALLSRFARAGLSPPYARDFKGQRPKTEIGWASYRDLLQREGVPDADISKEIESGLNQLRESEQAEAESRQRWEKIRAKEAEIRERLQSGGTLPNPTWPDTLPPIEAEAVLSSATKNLILWTAIRELGYDKDGGLRSIRSNAELELHFIEKRRGGAGKPAS